MCDVEFDGQNEFQCSIQRRARKDHNCYECRRGIKKGELYTRHSYKFDGDVDCHNTCSRCDRIAKAHSDAEHAMGGSGAFYYGQMIEMVRECATEHPEYVLNFRKAWKGEELPKYVRPPDPYARYSTVM